MRGKDKEKWQTYHANGEPIMNGGVEATEASERKNSGELYGCTNIWLYRRATTDIEVLFQQRAHSIDSFPDQWDVSAGGHINYGEDKLVKSVIREAKEEIGVNISPEELFYGFSTARTDRIIHTYFCDWTNRDPVFSFNDHEVQAVQWIPLSRIDTFREQFVKASLAQDNNYFALLKTWLAENASVERAVEHVLFSKNPHVVTDYQNYSRRQK